MTDCVTWPTGQSRELNSPCWRLKKFS